MAASTAKSESSSQDNAIPKLRFPSWYNPDSPEVKERRRKLFEDIAKNRTPESDAAMEEVAKMFAEDDDEDLND